MAVDTLTADIATRAGTGTVTMTHSSFPDDVSMEITDISGLEVEFDLDENTDNAETVFFSPSEFSFSVFDQLGDGSSLFGLLDDILSTDEIDVKLDFETDGGLSWVDDFTVTTNNIEYNRSSRMVDVEATLDVQGDSTVLDIMNNYPSDTPSAFKETIEDDSGNTGSCMPVREFIKYAMEDATDGSRVYINDSHDFNEDYKTDQKISWVVLTGHSGYKYKQSEDASSMLYRLGAVDGSIVGSLLGYNFFINRLNTGHDVTLSEDNLSKLDIMLGLKNYTSILTMFNSRLGGVTPAYDSWGMWGSLQGKSDGLNDDGTKTLKTYFFMLGLQPALWDTANDRFYDEGDVFTTDIGEVFFDGDETLEEGSRFVALKSSANISKGDVITFANDVSTPHLVRDYISNPSNDVIVLDTPLQKTLRHDEPNRFIDKFIQNYSNIAQQSAECYAHAYGANGARMIECTILDIDTLMPHQTFTLDSSFPQAVQNQTYRPSRINYNLMEDKIEVEGYAID